MMVANNAVINALLTACSLCFFLEAVRFDQTVDGNGNCERGDKVSLSWIFLSDAFEHHLNGIH